MLETISLENNRISFTALASPFQRLSQLTMLNLANNSINYLLEDFTLESLQMLNLSHNHIEVLYVGALNNIKTQEIDLTFNKIMEIGYDMDNYEPKLVRLDNNPIACDCRIHKFVNYLKNANKDQVSKPVVTFNMHELRCAEPERLADIKVTDIDPIELICPLDSKYTSVAKCPKDCSCFVRPEDMHILMECDASLDFSMVPALKNHLTELTIASSNLTDLPVVITLPDGKNQTGYELITNLTLRDNQLTSISLENLPSKLNTLDVRNNRLETFNETVRNFLSNATSMKLSLGGNPWRCDCSNKEFVDFVQEMDKLHKIVDASNVLCDNGKNLIKDVKLSELCSESENLLIMILCIITAIMGLVMGGLAALYYKYQKQIKMWLYSHNMLLWFVTEEELDKVSLVFC